ncbi:MAG TPA: MlaD family protein [Pseudolabrys sp.]|nr:MlaD family protein [Pseudolabrys sp.]
METKANYVLIGAFTLAVVAGVFGFVYWFQNVGGPGERTFYRIVFDGSVSGLRTGASVLFNGIRVGEVTELRLDPKKPQQVVATIGIDKAVAVREDTDVGLEFQGLTGIASVALRGGTAGAKLLTGSKEAPPMLAAAPGAAQDVTQGARETLRRIDQLIVDNRDALHSSLENLQKFTETLAHNSERIDRIAEGLQNLTGGDDGKSGEVNETVRSVRALVDNLDKRTDEITKSINQFASAGTKQLTTIGADARRVLNTADQTLKNIDRNPSRLLFGGSSSSDDASKDGSKARARAR